MLSAAVHFVSSPRMIDTNLLELIWTTKAFIPYLREKG
jgi:hypothetical protein